MIRDGYTRVTEILKQWDRFGQIKPEVLENKAKIGSNVHTAIKTHFEGIFYPLTEKEQPYFESFLRWYELTKPLFVDVEERLYDDSLMITGAIDALLKFPHSNEVILVDYKSSASPDHKMWPLQAGFYYMLSKKNDKQVSNRVLFVQLDKQGELPKVHEYLISQETIELCMCALKTYRYLHG